MYHVAILRAARRRSFASIVTATAAAETAVSSTGINDGVEADACSCVSSSIWRNAVESDCAEKSIPRKRFLADQLRCVDVDEDNNEADDVGGE